MNFKLILHMAKILALSSVRAKRAAGSVPTGFAKSPKINIIFFLISFPLAAFFANSFIGTFLADVSISPFFFQIAIFLPSFMTLASVMYGLLFEFSQSSSVGSSDIINWLPIRALEFVLASVLSMLYFLAPLLGLFFGAVFGLSLYVNMLPSGLISIAFGVLGIFLGAFLIEIIRAITNRVSASFYKRSGRTAVAVRMIISLLVMVTFILVTNANFLFTILQQFMGGIGNAWFIPILWPSLAVMNYLSAENLQVLLYTVASLGVVVAFIWASVKLRQKYWVPAPFSITLKPSKSYTPKRGLLGSLGFTSAEAALIRKDLRGLTRRKEMITWIAIPLAMSLISLFSFQSAWETATATPDKLMLFWGPLMGVFMFAFYIALTGIGQEGSAFLNLQVIPLKEEEVAKSKLALALFPSIIAVVALTAVIQLMLALRLEALITITVTLFAVLFECIFVGLAVGSRFPDFTEVPRARFVDQKGIWLGMAVIAVCIGVTFLPPFIYSYRILGVFPILIAPVLSVTACTLICYASYRAALNSLRNITQN
ncbi:MAG: hypothetical protein CW716_08000 [Candidatus Bathyarchaeum sp.]|nr:MAG: hypothetical protein CW716_08000 [Candidatus Bathyarchaeum sp.]